MEKDHKRSLKKAIGLIILVVILVLLASNIVPLSYNLTNKVKKYINNRESRKQLEFLKEWANDLSNYDENNYYMKITQTHNGKLGNTIEVYKKDDKMFLTETLPDGKIWKIQYIDSEIVIDASSRADGKIVASVYDYDPEDTIGSLNYRKPELYGGLTGLEYMEISDEISNLDIQTTAMKGNEICIITNVNDANTYISYVDKKTGLVLYENWIHCTSFDHALYSVGSKGGIMSHETGYYYEFGKVTDDDVQKPDLSEFILLE